MDEKIIETEVGQCFASLAKLHGFADPLTLYNHASNAFIKDLFPNLHLIAPGTSVTIPAQQEKEVALTNEQHNRFTVRGVLAELVLTVEDFDAKPLASLPYKLDVEGKIYEGKLDKTGTLSERVDACAQKGELLVYLDAKKTSPTDNAKNIGGRDQDSVNQLIFKLEIGSLLPPSECAAAQARLNNLGYYCANEDGTLDDSTKLALENFAKIKGLGLQQNGSNYAYLYPEIATEYGF